MAGTNSINVFEPGTKPYGLTYEEHVENFWKWALSLPAGKVDHDEFDKNPWNDQTGEDCASGQLDSNSPVLIYLVMVDMYPIGHAKSY